MNFEPFYESDESTYRQYEYDFVINLVSIGQLLHRAHEGDADAFAELQAQYEKQLRHYIGRMISSPHDMDDIIQRTFISLYLNLHRIDPPEKLRPFLYRVARNLAYDFLRETYRRNEVCIDDMALSLQNTSPPPEDAAQWSILFEQIRKCVDCLPDVQRDTLILHVEENLSLAEIAEIMNTEVGTVKSRLHYARKLLKQMLSTEITDMLDRTKPKRSKT